MSETSNATNGAIELAEANGLDLSQVKGTGKDGRVIKADVEAHLEGHLEGQAEPQQEATSKPTLRQVPIANRMQSFVGDPAEHFKSYRNKKTAISSYQRKVTYHADRNETVPVNSHGLTNEECLGLLEKWGVTA